MGYEELRLCTACKIFEPLVWIWTKASNNSNASSHHCTCMKLEARSLCQVSGGAEALEARAST